MIEATGKSKEIFEEISIASPRKIMWWKFLSHKMAVAAALVLIILYTMALFADFFAPYHPREQFRDRVYSPPSKIYFSLGTGDESLGFYVYPSLPTIDPQTMTRIYSEDTSKRYYVKLFHRGTPYSMLGFLKSDLRLFGVEGNTAGIHLFGTDTLGRDIFSRVIFGSRVSLTVALFGVFLSVVIGVTLGGIAGYLGGIPDSIIQRLSEVLLAFPTIPLWLALGAAVPPEWPPVLVFAGIVAILSLRGWTGLARETRGKFLSIKTEDYVLAAKLSGASTGRIIRAHMIPSMVSHIIAVITLSIPLMIIGETSLSFLGLGLRDPTISWGVLLQRAQNIHVIIFYPWMLIPSVFVVISVLAFNFLGDGLRDAADPFGKGV